MKDRLGREIDYMRISVTDRCNFRCAYCMPPEGAAFMENCELLRFEEILEIARAAAELGIRRIRVTGGEPFVRRGLLDFLEKLVQVPGIGEVAVTTNGSMLEKNLPRLKQTGIRGLNISLDTMDRQRFQMITGRDELPAVLRGIRQAASMGFARVKVNCVPMRGVNEEELCQVAALARDYAVDVRFIELMPLGLGQNFAMISQAEVVRRLEDTYGPVLFQDFVRGGGPAVYGHIAGFLGDIGFISAISHEFCSGCSRIRLLADGSLRACLNYESGTNLRELLRSGADREALKEVIRRVILSKPERHGFDDPENRRLKGQKTSRMFSIGG